jgi:hypothetical protein
MATYSNANACATETYASSLGNSAVFYYNKNRATCDSDSDSDSDLLLASTMVHDAPSSESEDDDDDDGGGYIVPSHKATNVSPLGASVGITYRSGSDINTESYCTREDADNDNDSAHSGSMDDDFIVPSSGLSSHDSSAAAMPHHRQTNVDDEVYDNIVACATKERPIIVTIIEKSSILMMHGFFRFHAALTKPFIHAFFLQHSRASISDLIARIVRRKNTIVSNTWMRFLNENNIF